jgi:hypothetical protein
MVQGHHQNAAFAQLLKKEELLLRSQSVPHSRLQTLTPYSRKIH